MEEQEVPEGASYAEIYGINEDGTMGGTAPAVPEAVAVPEVTAEVVATPEESPEVVAGTPGAQAPGENPFARVIAQLQEAGFDSADAVEAAMDQQVAQQSMEAELGALWEDLQAKIDAGEMTPEIAQMLYEAKEQNLQLSAQAQAQAAQMERQQAAQSAQALAQIDPSLGQFAQEAGLTPEASQALAKVLEQVMGKTKTAAVSQYVAEKTRAGGGSVTAPIPQGAATTPVPTDMDIDVSNMSYEDMFRLEGSLK